MSYQFHRGLGNTQQGGGSVSGCFQAASRMAPGDKENWFKEWRHVAERTARSRRRRGRAYGKEAIFELHQAGSTPQ